MQEFFWFIVSVENAKVESETTERFLKGLNHVLKQLERWQKQLKMEQSCSLKAKNFLHNLYA